MIRIPSSPNLRWDYNPVSKHWRSVHGDHRFTIARYLELRGRPFVLFFDGRYAISGATFAFVSFVALCLCLPETDRDYRAAAIMARLNHAGDRC